MRASLAVTPSSSAHKRKAGVGGEGRPPSAVARRAALDPVETPAAPRRARVPWATPWASPRAQQLAGVFLRAAPHATPGDPSHVEERERALRWVTGLVWHERAKPNAMEIGTRDRADRIAACGWLELCFQPKTGRVGYRHRWCRDRACPVCARHRAGRAREQLRAHLVERELARARWMFAVDEDGAITAHRGGELAFVTLTHPKLAFDVESPGAAVSRLLAEWRKLTNRRPFRRMVQGYVRAVECTFSKKGRREVSPGVWKHVKETGWHAHLHIVLELEHGFSDWEASRDIRAAWCGIAGADEHAQNWQALSKAKLGQVAKYITKPFELPDAHAPTFFDEMKGRRLVQGGGTWRDFTKHEDPPDHSWVPQGLHVAELIDKAKRGDAFVFRWKVDEDGVTRPVEYGARMDEATVARGMPAREALRILLEDGRPVSKRCTPVGSTRGP